jgi:hypothetical protein
MEVIQLGETLVGGCSSEAMFVPAKGILGVE